MEDHCRIRLVVSKQRVSGEHRVERSRGLAGHENTEGQSAPGQPPQRFIKRLGIAIIDQYATVEQGCWHSRYKSEDRPDESNLATGSMFRQLSKGAKKVDVSC
jgi:hypothetical protein